MDPEKDLYDGFRAETETFHGAFISLLRVPQQFFPGNPFPVEYKMFHYSFTLCVLSYTFFIQILSSRRLKNRSIKSSEKQHTVQV